MDPFQTLEISPDAGDDVIRAARARAAARRAEGARVAGVGGRPARMARRASSTTSRTAATATLRGADVTPAIRREVALLHGTPALVYAAGAALATELGRLALGLFAAIPLGFIVAGPWLDRRFVRRRK